MTSAEHRSWLRDQARRLLGFFRATVDETGTFVELDDEGRPLLSTPGETAPGQQQLLTVARTTHCYALSELLGVPGGGPIVELGLTAMLEQHRDARRGGYFSAITPRGPSQDIKRAYEHAFVLLAASSARAAGHPRAQLLYDDVLAILDEHFWSEQEGLAEEAFTGDWQQLEPYRGANSNMHLCESFLAAASFRGSEHLTDRSLRIARRLIDVSARQHSWLLPEHYDPSWQPQLDYNQDRRDDAFRPYGVIVGHSLEWSRLLLSIWLATDRTAQWLIEDAQQIYQRGMDVGWDEEHGGLAYTVDWDGSAANPDHYWWPIAEGIAASSYLARVTGDQVYERDYRRFWDFATAYLIDHTRGGWYAQLDPDNSRIAGPWYGKPDLYHALQACLLPALPLAPAVATALLEQGAGPDLHRR